MLSYVVRGAPRVERASTRLFADVYWLGRSMIPQLSSAELHATHRTALYASGVPLKAEGE
jgi:hypothetical protein